MSRLYRSLTVPLTTPSKDRGRMAVCEGLHAGASRQNTWGNTWTHNKAWELESKIKIIWLFGWLTSPNHTTVVWATLNRPIGPERLTIRRKGGISGKENCYLASSKINRYFHLRLGKWRSGSIIVTGQNTRMKRYLILTSGLIQNRWRRADSYRMDCEVSSAVGYDDLTKIDIFNQLNKNLYLYFSERYKDIFVPDGLTSI